MEIHFDWRVALHRNDREALHRTIVERLKYWAETGQGPTRVVISPLMFDPYDERVVIEIRSDSGEILGGSWPIEPKKSSRYSSAEVLALTTLPIKVN